MCLGIPMQIDEINGYEAIVSARGETRKISIWLLQHEELKIGDFVVVHRGQASEKITPERAKDAWDAYDEILELEGQIQKNQKLDRTN